MMIHRRYLRDLFSYVLLTLVICGHATSGASADTATANLPPPGTDIDQKDIAVHYLELSGFYQVSYQDIDIVVERIIRPATTIKDVDFDGIRKSLYELYRTTDERIIPLVHKHFTISILQSVNAFLQTPEGKDYIHALVTLDPELRREENVIRRDLYNEIAKKQPGSSAIPTGQSVPANVVDIEKRAAINRYLDLHKDFDRFMIFFMGGLLVHHSVDGDPTAAVEAMKEKYRQKYTELMLRVLAKAETIPVLKLVNAYLETDNGKTYIACLCAAENDLRTGQEQVGQIVAPVVRRTIAEYVPQKPDDAQNHAIDHVNNF
jgi:hypothetical protein